MFIDLMVGRQVAPDFGGPGYDGVQSESPDQRERHLVSLRVVNLRGSHALVACNSGWAEPAPIHDRDSVTEMPDLPLFAPGTAK